MPFLIVAALLAGLGFALHNRAQSAAGGVLRGDFFNSENSDAPITFGAPSTQSVASVQPSALDLSGVSSLLNAFSIPTTTAGTGTLAAPSVPDLLTQQQQQQPPGDKPFDYASEPLPGLCDVEVRTHPGYHVVCNGKQYS